MWWKYVLGNKTIYKYLFFLVWTIFFHKNWRQVIEPYLISMKRQIKLLLMSRLTNYKSKLMLSSYRKFYQCDLFHFTKDWSINIDSLHNKNLKGPDIPVPKNFLSQNTKVAPSLGSIFCRKYIFSFPKVYYDCTKFSHKIILCFKTIISSKRMW